MKSTNVRATAKRNRVIREIEDVQERFCGSRRKSLTSVADYAPLVAYEWCYAKNCGWGPEDFSHGSNVKAWWQCQVCQRTYKASICNRVGRQSNCPFCTSKKVCDDNALSVHFPELVKDWHPIKNGKLKITEFTRSSSKKAWWLCSKCGHEWETVIAERSFLRAGCPACYRARIDYQKAHHVKATRNPMVIGQTAVPRDWYRNPARQFESLSQSHPEIAKQWHPIRNGEWTPDDFSRASGVKAWWQCPAGEDHEWQATICHRTQGNRSCPYCSGNKVSRTTSLQFLHPELATQWHPQLNGALTPDRVMSGSDKKVWWQCERFKDHFWEASLYSRAKRGTGCPQCKSKVNLSNQSPIA